MNPADTEVFSLLKSLKHSKTKIMVRIINSHHLTHKIIWKKLKNPINTTTKTVVYLRKHLAVKEVSKTNFHVCLSKAATRSSHPVRNAGTRGAGCYSTQHITQDESKRTVTGWRGRARVPWARDGAGERTCADLQPLSLPLQKHFLPEAQLNPHQDAQDLRSWMPHGPGDAPVFCECWRSKNKLKNGFTTGGLRFRVSKRQAVWGRDLLGYTRNGTNKWKTSTFSVYEEREKKSSDN